MDFVDLWKNDNGTWTAKIGNCTRTFPTADDAAQWIREEAPYTP